jgi:hypothetical protein
MELVGKGTSSGDISVCIDVRLTNMVSLWLEPDAGRSCIVSGASEV